METFESVLAIEASPSVLWLDGLDGQEDELDAVKRGKLEPLTDDEAEEEVIEPNKGDVALAREDEDAKAPGDAGTELRRYPGFQ